MQVFSPHKCRADVYQWEFKHGIQTGQKKSQYRFDEIVN